MGRLWAFLEVPAAWPADPLDGDLLPPRVTAHLRRFREETRGGRVIFIRRSFRPVAEPTFLLARLSETRPNLGRWRLGRYEDLLDLDLLELGIELEAAAEGWSASAGSPAADPEPVFLVCAHGRHDRCCARWGYPFYRALAEEAGTRAWQCSHIGGDRFAANLVWLPWGVFYGRMEPGDADRLLAASARREILLDRYRGRSCHRFPVQAAEYFLRRAWGELGADALRLVEVEREGEAGWRVRLATAAGRAARVEVRRERSEPRRGTTCRTLDQERRVPVYRLVGIEEEEA